MEKITPRSDRKPRNFPGVAAGDTCGNSRGRPLARNDFLCSSSLLKGIGELNVGTNIYMVDIVKALLTEKPAYIYINIYIKGPMYVYIYVYIVYIYTQERQ